MEYGLTRGQLAAAEPLLRFLYWEELDEATRADPAALANVSEGCGRRGFKPS